MAFLDIKFDLDLSTTEVDGKRHYLTPEGTTYPSMTTVLSNYNKEGLQQWRDRVGEKEATRIMNQAAAQGTSVHNLCEAYVLGKELPPANSFERARFNQVKPIIDNDIQNVYACETALYSDYLKVAGRTDVIGKFRGVNSIIDYKNSRKPKKMEWISNYWLQEAGYAVMWAERTKSVELAPKQLVLIITVEHEEPQIFIQPVTPWVNKLKEYLSETYPAFKA